MICCYRDPLRMVTVKNSMRSKGFFEWVKKTFFSLIKFIIDTHKFLVGVTCGIVSSLKR